MKQKKVVGVAGMPGAGKATVRTTAEELGFTVVIMGDVIRDEAKRRGLEPTPENVGKVMLELRKEEGDAVVAKRCVSKIESTPSDVVFVDGVRSLSEVGEFRKRFSSFTLLAVHSSPETRFKRLSKRKRSDDAKSWSVFCRRDQRELSVGQGDVIAMADFMVVNDRSYEEFKDGVREVVQVVLEKWTK